jgi:ATP-dependent nuclease, subunit B
VIYVGSSHLCLSTQFWPSQRSFKLERLRDRIGLVSQNSILRSKVSFIIYTGTKFGTFIIQKKVQCGQSSDYRGLTSISQATWNAWNAPFMGKAHELLAITINAMNRARGTAPYANYLPIIQSSGTGKSRTVHELARLVFTIPFNLRAASEASGTLSHFIVLIISFYDNTGYAFPVPDPSIRDYLTRKRFLAEGGFFVDPKYDDIRAAYLVFIIELFKVIRAKLIQNMKRQSTTEDLAAAWREHLEPDKRSDTSSIRQSTYNEVIKVCYISANPR